MVNTRIAKACTLRTGLLVAAMLLAAATAALAQVPDTVTLKSMAELYEPVVLDHAMHADIAECAVCHHQTTGKPEAGSRCANCHAGNETNAPVACRACHEADPFSAAALAAKEADSERYHVDKPGLKGAYHLNCLGCHEQMGGPVGCQDCHARTPEGDAVFHADAHPAEGGSTH